VFAVFFLSLCALVVYIAIALIRHRMRQRGAPKEDDDSGFVFLSKVRGRLSGFPFVRIVLIFAAVLLCVMTVTRIFYTVPEGSETIVVRLGIPVGIKGPGFHAKIPFLDSTYSLRTGRVLRQEFGFRTVRAGPPAQYEDVPIEQAMLTRDNKIVRVEWALQFRIADPLSYFLNLMRNSDATDIVRNWSESSMREVVASRELDKVLTVEREAIQKEARKTIQARLDAIHSGLVVTAVTLQDVLPPQAVIDALNDVTTAKSEKDRDILRAEEYYNDVVPKAEGEASRILNDAEAYRDRRVAAAKGETSRLASLKEAYLANPELVRLNFYMENLRDGWSKARVVFVEDNVVNFLSLGGEDPPFSEAVRRQSGQQQKGQ
jgi:membrane protease subunit HflK